jgi:serine/threonine-protein kinase HipA
MQMAKDCGINVPECKLEHFSKFGSTFLVKRFDRLKDKRIHFSSAMTLLGKTDGAIAQEGSSYLELADFIMSYGAVPDVDLHELWKRIVFSIAVSNTDDHLRNHGFLLTPSGWRLSPAYDINPNPLGHGLSLNISDCDNSLDFSLALEVASFFRLSDNEAEKILKNIVEIVRKWKDYASTLGISRSDQEEMQTAFRWK